MEFTVRYSGELEVSIDKEAGNYLIGEFVSKEGLLTFSSDWNHLINVVEIIEEMGVIYTCQPIRNRVGYPKQYLAVFEPDFKKPQWKDREEVFFGREFGSNRLEATWKAVVYFLLWYRDKK